MLLSILGEFDLVTFSILFSFVVSETRLSPSLHAETFFTTPPLDPYSLVRDILFFPALPFFLSPFRKVLRSASPSVSFLARPANGCCLETLVANFDLTSLLCFLDFS